MSEGIKEIAQFDNNLIKSLEDFMESYKMVDVDQVYSNGTEFVPIFRVKQWLEYNNITNLQNQLQQKGKEIERLNKRWNELKTYINDMWLDDKGSVRRLQEFIKLLEKGE